jgi:hypothetical protein
VYWQCELEIVSRSGARSLTLVVQNFGSFSLSVLKRR